MNINEQLTHLSEKLEDTEIPYRFDNEFKLKALKNAEIKLANMLDLKYLTSLGVIETSLAVYDGRIALSSLSNAVLKGSEGILKVKITGGKYARRIDIEDLKKTENPLLGGQAQSPRYYVFQNEIYILPETTVNLDVYYLRIPPPLLYEFLIATGTVNAFVCYDDQNLSTETNYYKGAVIYCLDKNSYHVVTAYTGSPATFTVSPDAVTPFAIGNKFYFITHPFDRLNLEGISCILNASMYRLVVKLAEAECWTMDNKADRSELALRSVIEEVNVLNSRVDMSKGIGTESKR